MSKYSEKSRGTAQCHVEDCTEPGTKIEMRDGELNWYCETHARKT